MTFVPHIAPIEDFTPPSLAELPDPPVFKLRPPRRGIRDFRYEIRAAGLIVHSDAEIRAEAINGLRALWPAEAADEGIAKLRALWDAADRGEQLAPDDQAALDELSSRLRRAWPALSRMAAENGEFLEAVPSIAISLVTVGWPGLEVPHGRTNDVVPIEQIEAVADALAAIEREAGLEVGVAFAELSARALGIINGTDPRAPTADSTPEPTPATPKASRRRATKGAAK